MTLTSSKQDFFGQNMTLWKITEVAKNLQFVIKKM